MDGKLVMDGHLRLARTQIRWFDGGVAAECSKSTYTYPSESCRGKRGKKYRHPAIGRACYRRVFDVNPKWPREPCLSGDQSLHK